MFDVPPCENPVIDGEGIRTRALKAFFLPRSNDRRIDRNGPVLKIKRMKKKNVHVRSGNESDYRLHGGLRVLTLSSI